MTLTPTRSPMFDTRFGLDAPGLLRGFFLAGLALLALAAGLIRVGGPGLWIWLGLILVILALYPLGMACLMLFDSWRTKPRHAETLLDQVRWSGAEQVLDVGCGRGMMLVKAAQRLTTGRATGVDIWQASDQSGNTENAALDNARAGGVSDRTAVQTADMRTLPFADAAFDVVTSSWAVHNLDAQADRAKALSEMARVLCPDGWLILSDIINRAEYQTALTTLGLRDIRLVVQSAWRDRLLGLVSFGSYTPFAIIARGRIAPQP